MSAYQLLTLLTTGKIISSQHVLHSDLSDNLQILRELFSTFTIEAIKHLQQIILTRIDNNSQYRRIDFSFTNPLYAQFKEEWLSQLETPMDVV